MRNTRYVPGGGEGAFVRVLVRVQAGQSPQFSQPICRDCALWHRESANATQRNGEGAGPGTAWWFDGGLGGPCQVGGDRTAASIPHCTALCCVALLCAYCTVHIDCTRINVLVVETIDWIHQSSTVLN